MTLIVTELLDAFQEAGVSDGTARRAAALLAGFDGRFDKLDGRIENLEARLSARTNVLEANFTARCDLMEANLGARIDSVRSGQDWLKVPFGLLFSLNVAIFLKLFLH